MALKKNMLKRIGIFGGTFNPPHVGHLVVARFVADRLKLDKIFFVPSYISPHKNRGEERLAKHRLNMVNLAIAHEPHFEVWEGEMERKGRSFTYRTLEEFRQDFPGARLFLLIGADNVAEFGNWKYPRRILQLATVVAMSRPDSGVEGAGKSRAKGMRYLRVPAVEVSSSIVRSLIKNQKSIVPLVPASVRRYISRHKLYA